MSYFSQYLYFQTYLYHTLPSNIELELKSNSKDISKVLDKTFKLVKKFQGLGFEVDELKINQKTEKNKKKNNQPFFDDTRYLR